MRQQPAHGNDESAPFCAHDKKGNSTTAGSVAPWRLPPHGCVQMPHDEAWDRVAFFLLAARIATGGMSPVAGNPDKVRAVHTKVRRSQAGEAHLQQTWPIAAAGPGRAATADQCVEGMQAQAQGWCFQGHTAYSQGKGRLRLSGCVLLAGTPQQRPSVSAYRHRNMTCCERCWAWLASGSCVIARKILPGECSTGRRNTGGETSCASSYHSDHALRSMQTLKRHGNITRRRIGPGRVSSVLICEGLCLSLSQTLYQRVPRHVTVRGWRDLQPW